MPLLLFITLVFPLVWILEWATVFMQSLIKGTQDPTVTEQELITLAEHGAKEGTIEHNEKNMIERIFAFNELRARDVMIPKHQLFTLDCEQTIGQALRKIAARPYTRSPLCNSKNDKITRVVNLREVLKEAVKGHMGKPPKKVSHETPLYAPLNQPIEQLFSTLRNDERRPVIVVDEYGVTQGMFTLEDMLEELVGEIHDDIDNQQQIEEVQEGELLVNGSEELRIVEDHLSVYLSGKPTDTVSHWILEHVEHIPVSGEQFTLDGLEILIEKASKRRIRLVRLTCPI